ncbi:MAG: hypothetical protein R3C13_03650 [Hyphomonas sp.]|uniref:hypothetical protein n=1 Tax=Hyphomonas sp. TaxID=87 RepID=UPI003526CFDF
MKIRPVAGTIAAAVLLGACTTVPPEPAAAPEPGDLNGTWDVSMFYAADQPPSSTVMVLEAGGDGALAGSFYGSGFEEGRWSLRGEVLAFGAVTSDASAPYSHSGRLAADGRIEGQTLSHGRDFLMIWVAERRVE